MLVPEPRWSSPLHTVDGRLLETKGEDVCDWIEDNCVLGEGDYFGQSIRLDPYQRRWLYRLYEFFPETGVRRYKKALLGVAKGNGKSPLAAAVAAYELCSGLNDFPRVIIGAASFDQADVTFGDLSLMVTGPPDKPGPLAPYVEVYEREIHLKGQSGLAQRIAAQAATNDGARATCFIGDELHEWTMQKKRVFIVVSGAIAKRRTGFSFGITTAGVVGEDSAGEELYEYGLKVSKGLLVDDEFLFEWYEPADDADLSTPEGWEEAVRAANPAFDSFVNVGHLRYRWQTMPDYEFERYHLNRWTAATQRWLPLDAWNACAGTPNFSEGDDCYVGVDAAYKRDTSAVMAVFPKSDGKLHVLTRIFTPPGGGELLDPTLAEDYILELCQRYNVLAAPYDPWQFMRSALLLIEKGAPLEEVPQNPVRMVPAAQALYDAVTQGRIVHDGDPELAAQVDAAVMKDTGTRGWMLDKKRSTRPIDAVVALAMAVSYAEEDSSADGYLMMA
jgi:phage terminase large subunit-like protein